MLRQRLAPWLLPAALLVAWELASRSGALSARILPEPAAVLAAFWQLLRSGELAHHVGVSAARAFSALALGGGLGLLLGLLTGTWRTAETLLDTTLQMLRNIPALALIPLVILWFGIDEAAKLVLVAVGVFFPIYLNTFHGIRNVDRDLIEMARSYGLSGWPLYRQVILPGALPSILVGLRFSLGLMWVLLIVAEDAVGAGRHRLPDDERARVPADRRGAGGHPALRAAGQAGRRARPRPGARLAALAPRLRR